MIKVSALDFKLPEWQESDFQLVREAERKVASVGNSAGKSSEAFKDACEELKYIARRKGRAPLRSALAKAIDVRAFTYLLATDDEFAKSISLHSDLLDAVLVPRNPLSKLSLLQLIRAFFVRFDELVSADGLKTWCEFQKAQLSAYDGKKDSNDLTRYAKYAVILFSESGPHRVVTYAKSNQMDFDNVVPKLGLTGFSGGRYLTLCRYQYYLESLKSIPVGSDDAILLEVTNSDVVNAPYADDKLLGHAILEVLIDRSEGQSISRSWQSTILSIAGDPRVPRSSRNYQQWWALLGEKRIALMRGWLSRFDLSLFLGILEQSAKDNSDKMMERMFKPRKIFMEGLLEQGIILESRLFLTSAAEYYLVKNYKKNELPSIAKVKGGQASVIYLRLKNGVHFVEGTHSFSIRVMDKLPTKTRLDDYSVNTYHSRDLGAGLGEAYFREYKNDGGIIAEAHDTRLNWQNKVLQHLKKYKIELDIGMLLPPNKYREYKSKFGAY